MPNKQIMIDGRAVTVDASRLTAFDGLRGEIARAFSGDGRSVGDAGEALAFLVSQLAYTEAQAFEKLYTPMQFRELVPVVSEGGWADTIRYEMIDYAGKGKRISGAGHDIPMAEVQFGEKTFPVVSGAIGYSYTFEEMQKSAFFRTALPTAKMQAAMTAAERHLNEVALYGESASNITGLFNSSVVPQASAPVGGWGTATPTQILGDINALILSIWEATAYNEMPTDIVLAPSAMATLASKPRSDNSDKTVLEYIKENNIAKVERGITLNFRSGYGLNTAGAGATRRMMAYVRNSAKVKMHIPMELQFLAPQFTNLSVKVPGTYRYSGVEFRYPKSAAYQDGI